METSALKAFVAVAQTGSFSIAGQQLHLSQPAVSKRIALLEQQLDTRLFDRANPKIMLTEAGDTLFDSAQRILAELSLAEHQIRSLGQEVSGRLRLSTSHHIGIHRLPPVLRQYCAHYPRVELDLQFQDSEIACADVVAGRLELAVITLPERVPDNVVATEIWPDPMEVVVPTDHALLALENPGVDDLLKFPAVLPAVGTVTRAILETALNPFSVKLGVTLETNYLETIKMMVSVGLGWSLLPRSMLGDDIAAVPINGLETRRSLGTVVRRHRSLTRAAASFLDVLQTNASVIPDPAE